MAQTHAVMVNPKKYGDNLDVDKGSLYFRSRVYYSDFATAATTGEISVLRPVPWANFPAGIEIEGAGLSLITNFTGGGNATATLAIGSATDPDLYLDETDVFTGAYKSAVGLTIVPFTMVAGTGAPAKGTVQVTLVTSVNTNLLTAGKADIYLKLRAVSLRTT